MEWPWFCPRARHDLPVVWRDRGPERSRANFVSFLFAFLFAYEAGQSACAAQYRPQQQSRRRARALRGHRTSRPASRTMTTCRRLARATDGSSADVQFAYRPDTQCCRHEFCRPEAARFTALSTLGGGNNRRCSICCCGFTSNRAPAASLNRRADIPAYRRASAAPRPSPMSARSRTCSGSTRDNIPLGKPRRQRGGDRPARQGPHRTIHSRNFPGRLRTPRSASHACSSPAAAPGASPSRAPLIKNAPIILLDEATRVAPFRIRALRAGGDPEPARGAPHRHRPPPVDDHHAHNILVVEAASCRIGRHDELLRKAAVCLVYRLQLRSSRPPLEPSRDCLKVTERPL